MNQIKNFVEKVLQKLRFKQVIPYIKGEVLDYGCGDMGISKFIKGHYVGTEDNNFPKRKYDTILLLAVIEHLENPKRVIGCLRKYLDDAGIFIATLPTVRGERIAKLLSKLGLSYSGGREEHIECYNKKQALALFKDFSTTHRYFEFGYNQMIIARK